MLPRFESTAVTADRIGKTAVGESVRRAAVAGLGWPIPDEIEDAELERQEA